MLIALIIIVLVVAVLLATAASRPDQFRIERSATIKATPERIFPYINDLHRWQAWSPYEKKDPAMQRSFEGPASGPGAAYGWSGNKNIGSGRMEISESTPSSRVRIKLDFFTPFKASNTAEFVLEPTGDATRITWSMQGRSNYMSKLMGLAFNIDKMVGKDFEDGLVNLRMLTEQNP
ncbi:SRPBCC family protein [Dyella telluris]|uniref:SRPBCC family protein n=1 Tax=Dyella telluris TaxID=2763498 RepID=A0A7G8Q8G1_9GAMM|nr:SRPBCC family protein [Dyella telluris]QNK03069.1 SRPBCC family protein [Dyella telluris]